MENSIFPSFIRDLKKYTENWISVVSINQHVSPFLAVLNFAFLYFQFSLISKNKAIYYNTFC